MTFNAHELLQQLGGNKFLAMTGAKDFLKDESARSLQFGLKRAAKDGINKVRIILDSSDLYTIEFWKVRGVKVVKVRERAGVFGDMLAQVFEHNTGLYTSL